MGGAGAVHVGCSGRQQARGCPCCRACSGRASNRGPARGPACRPARPAPPQLPPGPLQSQTPSRAAPQTRARSAAAWRSPGRRRCAPPAWPPLRVGKKDERQVGSRVGRLRERPLAAGAEAWGRSRAAWAAGMQTPDSKGWRQGMHCPTRLTTRLPARCCCCHRCRCLHSRLPPPRCIARQAGAAATSAGGNMCGRAWVAEATTQQQHSTAASGMQQQQEQCPATGTSTEHQLRARCWPHASNHSRCRTIPAERRG